MSLIVLLTDFGTRDYFAGVMKGVIASINPVVHVIDLSHDIEPQDVRQASFVLWASRRSFPEDTIFVNVVDPGVGTGRKIICAKLGGQFFMAPDNGLLDYIAADSGPGEYYTVTNRSYFMKDVSSTFHGRDIFAPVAAHISRGVRLGDLGEKYRYPDVRPFYKRISSGRNAGEVVYHDRFGNVFTNLLWDDRLQSGGASIRVGTKVVSEFHESYADARGKKPVGVKGSSGLLEVAINRGNAAKALKTKIGHKIVLTIG